MKPIRLDIEGLHSFREPQTIDFAALAESGLFGIFGPTGSGKSTILDAMTIALYGKVERNGRLGHTVNQAVGFAAVAFTFSVTGAAGVEVYRVERNYRRTPDGGLQRHNARLLRFAQGGRTEVVADRVDTVHESVATLLGLAFEDFTRAVVLPQGKFAEFLGLAGAERRQMLERLFSLERFGRGFTDRLQSRQREADSLLQAVTAELSALSGSSDDALVALRAECEAAEQAVTAAEMALGVAARQRQAAFEVRELQAAKGAAEGSLAALEARDGARVEALRAAVSRAERSARVQPLLIRFRHAQEGLAATRQAERERLDLATGARALADEGARAETSARAEQDAAVPGLLLQRAALVRGRELEAAVAALLADEDRLGRERDRLLREQAELRERAEASVRRRDELERQKAAQRALMAQAIVTPEQRAVQAEVRGVLQPLSYAQEARRRAQVEWGQREKIHRAAGVERDAAMRAAEAAQGELTALERALAASAETPVDERKLQDDRLAAAGLADAAERLRALEGVLKAGRLDMEQVERQVRDAHGRQLRLTQRREAAFGALAQARERWMARLLEDRRAAAQRLAQDLVAGEPCPVCGSTEHPGRAWTAVGAGQAETQWGHGSDGGDGAESAPLSTGAPSSDEIDLAHAEEAMRTREAELAAQDAALREAEREWADARARQTSLEERIAAQERDRAQEFSAIERRTGATFVTVQEVAARLGELQAAIDAGLAQLVAWREERGRLAESLRESGSEVQERRSLLARADVQLEAAQSEEAAALRMLQAADADVLQASAAAGAVLARAGVVHDGDLLQAGERFSAGQDDSIRKRDAAYAKAAKQAEAADRELADAVLQIGESERALAQRAMGLDQLDREIDRTVRALEVQREQLFQLTGGLSIDGALADIDDRLARLRTTVEEVATAARRARVAADNAERSHLEAEIAARSAAAEVDRLRAEAEAALLREGFATIGEALDAGMDDDAGRSAAQEIERFAETRRRLAFDCDRLAKELGGRSVAPGEWADLDAAESEAQDVKRRAFERLGAARGSLESAEARHDRWRELTERADGLSQETGLLQELAGLFRGNAFVDFLAQEQLTAVTRMATDHLSRVTGGRYALELSDRGDFIMRDDFAGGERRPVSTLSGGETFMTSLAMALALSGQIQLHGRYPLQFFFLDEGFGTLDPERLDTVVSSLERLPKGDMLVGVITHVPEMRQRIERRLMVEAATPLHGTRVRVDRGS